MSTAKFIIHLILCVCVCVCVCVNECICSTHLLINFRVYSFQPHSRSMISSRTESQRRPMYGYTVQLIEVPKTILPRSTASKPLRQPNYGTYFGTRGVLSMPQVVPIVYYFLYVAYYWFLDIFIRRMLLVNMYVI